MVSLPRFWPGPIRRHDNDKDTPECRGAASDVPHVIAPAPITMPITPIPRARSPPRPVEPEVIDLDGSRQTVPAIQRQLSRHGSSSPSPLIPEVRHQLPALPARSCCSLDQREYLQVPCDSEVRSQKSPHDCSRPTTTSRYGYFATSTTQRPRSLVLAN